MKVFKFGGASIKDAKGIRNVASIIQSSSAEKLLVVVSAMGKTTNALEAILNQSRTGQDYQHQLNSLKKYHADVMYTLFRDRHPAFQEVENVFLDVEHELKRDADVDLIYDQVVSRGETIATKILHHFLLTENVKSHWVYAGAYIVTDHNFREGKVDWPVTSEKINTLKSILDKNIIITQGFIGQTKEGLTTTLGREGSDYSAAIFASCLDAASVTIWKDVPGVMNADPKRLPAAIVFEELPFKEAAEMTFYGASVIHPKTIKPLANKGIPLWVKNFDNPSLPGTKIHECQVDDLPPLIVFKDNQCLISCKVTDYTFISEQQLSAIFIVLAELDIKINVMQSSAITFSFCIDFRESKVMKLIEKLQQNFEVYYNLRLTLITVKNYDDQSFETYRKQPNVLLEQSSRSTLQVLVRG